jgi:hypothetical protein
VLVIEHGDVFDPAPRGTTTIVVSGGRIEKIGDDDPSALASAFAP